MNNFGADPTTQMMGLGAVGEVRAGPDGNLYQWVEGYDGLGNPIGFWRRLRRLARSAVSRVPAVAAARAALRMAAGPQPGSYPQPARAAVEGWGLGADELTQMMGLGTLGEVRAAPDGNLYQWIEGYDGLGNPFGFWKAIRRRVKRFVRKAMPIVQNLTPFVPGLGPAVAAGLKVATPYLKQAGVMGVDGLGALYQAPDGSLYQVQGLADEADLRGWDGLGDDDLRGLGALYQAPDGSLFQVQGLADDELRAWDGLDDDDLNGLDADDELRGWGLAADDDLNGLDADDELRGFAADEELRGWGLAADDDLNGLDADDELRGWGLAADDDLNGLDDVDGYVPDTGMNGLEAYVPEQAPQTRWFTPPGQAPELWRPLW